MEAVYNLWHFRIGSEDEPDMSDPSQMPMQGGRYSSEKRAQAVIERARHDPRFRDWPGGFRVFRAPLNVDHWVGGFVSWDDA